MKRYELSINGNNHTVKVKSISKDKGVLIVNDKEITVDIKKVDDPDRLVRGTKTRRTLSQTSAKPPVGVSASAGSADAVTAPIPGQIFVILVKVGDQVTRGQPVIKIEAMKMESEINAHKDGVVSEIKVQPNSVVSQGQELIIIK